MIEQAILDIEANMNSHIINSHSAVYERSAPIINTPSQEAVIYYHITNLEASKVFFSSILENHKYMELTDTNIDHFVNGLDDLIDEYLVIIESEAKTELEKKYFKLAADFLDVITKTQVELGFYKVERRA